MLSPRLVRQSSVKSLRQGGSDLASKRAAWKGERHDWAVRVGRMAPEVLEWIRSDPCFDTKSDAFAALGVTFTGGGKDFKTEEGRKFIKSGSVGGPSCSGQMCQLSLKEALPSQRIQQWFRAFRAENSVLRVPVRTVCTYASRHSTNGAFLAGGVAHPIICTPGSLFHQGRVTAGACISY